MDEQQIIEMATGVINLESKAVASLVEQLKPSLVQAAQVMLNCRGHVIVAGSGTSHAVALRFAHLLSCCGTPALFLHPGDSQHGSAGAVRAEDVLVALSKGGETTEVNFLARVAKERGATVIGITEKPASTLAHLSDITLEVKAPEDVDPYGMIATGSSLFNSAFCDALCIVLLNLRGYTVEQFGQTHPGGAVGLKLKGASQV
ncbi:MAG TPA: SIS domain-containing protein [Anaerolineales bacterium]|jgi:arabinose-5-phosphate isomerase|nr:SIS domain-containing protein [Anaerolineales bacterium]